MAVSPLRLKPDASEPSTVTVRSHPEMLALVMQGPLLVAERVAESRSVNDPATRLRIVHVSFSWNSHK